MNIRGLLGGLVHRFALVECQVAAKVLQQTASVAFGLDSPKIGRRETPTTVPTKATLFMDPLMRFTLPFVLFELRPLVLPSQRSAVAPFRPLANRHGHFLPSH